MPNKRKHRGRWPLQHPVSCALIKGCLRWHFWLGTSSIFQAWRDLPTAWTFTSCSRTAACERLSVSSFRSGETQGDTKLWWHRGPWVVMEKSEWAPETWDSHTIKPLSFAQHSQGLKLKSSLTPSAVREGQEVRQKARTEVKPSPPAGQGVTSSFSVSAHPSATKL